MGSGGSCYATERKVHKITSPAGPLHLEEILQQRDNTLRSGSSCPNHLKDHTAIAPRGLSSLLGPRLFSWQCNPCSPGTQPQMLFLGWLQTEQHLCCFTQTHSPRRVLLQESRSNTAGTQRAKERLVIVSILTVLESFSIKYLYRKDFATGHKTHYTGEGKAANQIVLENTLA